MDVLLLPQWVFLLLLVSENCVADKKDDGRGHWGEWGQWSACSASCGAGVAQIKRRWIPGPNDPPTKEPYTSSKVYSCFNEAMPNCPQNGAWSGWTMWSECTKACGVGSKHRKRDCVGIKFQGKPCEGKNEEKSACNKDPCPPLPRHFNMSQCMKSKNFTCTSGRMCIQSTQKCDRKVQCHDGSDEMGCPRWGVGSGSIRYELTPGGKGSITSPAIGLTAFLALSFMLDVWTLSL